MPSSASLIIDPRILLKRRSLLKYLGALSTGAPSQKDAGERAWRAGMIIKDCGRKCLISGFWKQGTSERPKNRLFIGNGCGWRVLSSHGGELLSDAFHFGVRQTPDVSALQPLHRDGQAAIEQFFPLFVGYPGTLQNIGTLWATIQYVHGIPPRLNCTCECCCLVMLQTRSRPFACRLRIVGDKSQGPIDRCPGAESEHVKSGRSGGF